jgi:CheY-like chemotaxis protein
MISTPEQTSQRPEAGIKGKLLIVDDEAAIRWALQKTLQRMNFEIVEAETGEQAIALVRTVRFDAVLLDIGMPGMNGIETCRKVRKLMPLLGIVMLTVKNAEDDKIQALDAGADDYITKPFHGGELAARLRAAVRRAHASRADDAATISIGEIELDPPAPAGEKGGSGSPLDTQGIRAASPPHVARRTAAYASTDSFRRLGTGVWRRTRVSPYICQAAAEEARRRRLGSQIPCY